MRSRRRASRRRLPSRRAGRPRRDGRCDQRDAPGQAARAPAGAGAGVSALEPLLTAQQLGALLGFAPGTIVDWAEAGKLPAFKIGGRLRFRLSEVEAWIEEQRHESSPPPV